MPLTRQFVAIDGESWETFLPPESSPRRGGHGKSLSSLTVACSESSPLETLLACHGDPPHNAIQIDSSEEKSTREPSHRLVHEHENCGVYDATASALKSALLLNDDDDLNCGVYDSATNALRRALQLGEGKRPVQMMNDDDDDAADIVDLGLPSRLNSSDTVLMDNRSSPGVMRLTEGGLKRHEQKSCKQPMYAPSDTHENYNEWKRHQEMRKWWKHAKQQAMERESRGAAEEAAPTTTITTADGGSKGAADHQGATVEMATPNNLARPKWSLSFRSKKTAEPLHTTPNAGDGDTVPTAHVNNNNNTCPKRQRTRSDWWVGIGKMDQVDREEKRSQRLREKELERHRKRQADAKKNLLSSIIKSHSSESMIGMTSNNKKKNTTKQLSTAAAAAVVVTAVSTIPCSICSKGERTHIATPCMHFSFCETCANKLKGRPCPVCGTDNNNNNTKSTYKQVLA
jgi:hypothetical protein